MAYKRTAFCHEKEVRLINAYRYKDEQDVQQHVKAVLVQYEHPERVKIIESLFSDEEFDKKMERLIELLNLGDKRKETAVFFILI